MIRYATPQDGPAALKCMLAAGMGASWYRYETMDGAALVDIDDATGAMRGYVRYTLGRPETFIRQLVVHPDHQDDGLVMKELLRRVIVLAELYGSQGIEAFCPESKRAVAEMFVKAGAVLDAGQRVQWLLTPAAKAANRAWLERAGREALR